MVHLQQGKIMRAILTVLLFFSLNASLHAQGRVVLANTATTLITCNGTPLTPAGEFRMGLYVGPLGTPSFTLELVGLATNGVVPGIFDGDNAFALPSSSVLSPGGYPAGIPINFEIRVWPLLGGVSYEQALVSGFFGFPNGRSSFGAATPSAIPSPAAPLFGNFTGQVGGFNICVPEPTALTLGLLGAVVLLFRRPRSS
jgi:hypothetical protein